MYGNMNMGMAKATTKKTGKKMAMKKPAVKKMSPAAMKKMGKKK